MTDQQKLQALSYALGLLRGSVMNVINYITDQKDYDKFIWQIMESDKIIEEVLYKEDK